MSDPFIYLQFIRQFMATLPGTSEGICYGTPGFYVQKKLLARLWENGEVLVVHTEDRDKWMQANSEVFFITDHYKNYPYVLVQLDTVDPEELKKLLIECWLQRASKTLVKEYGKS
ncbi:MmcQ/YjbR family DNA-binding protein [Mucilaginibacter sp. BT774]|uniref:MmcQ/YjbR family DNA-binding protein n=1 Tax=Mucilaginibacter sp. BT774 TaxID=3062276 RepID=UPI002676E2FB|nr:hypothetical protein [Mucilaginibacter sp. BT774]MDO3628404.1 hypothetical protein [Mucilaginibacter sp. BT774]